MVYKILSSQSAALPNASFALSGRGVHGDYWGSIVGYSGILTGYQHGNEAVNLSPIGIGSGSVCAADIFQAQLSKASSIYQNKSVVYPLSRKCKFFIKY